MAAPACQNLHKFAGLDVRREFGFREIADTIALPIRRSGNQDRSVHFVTIAGARTDSKPLSKVPAPISSGLTEAVPNIVRAALNLLSPSPYPIAAQSRGVRLASGTVNPS